MIYRNRAHWSRLQAAGSPSTRAASRALAFELHERRRRQPHPGVAVDHAGDEVGQPRGIQPAARNVREIAEPDDVNDRGTHRPFPKTPATARAARPRARRTHRSRGRKPPDTMSPNKPSLLETTTARDIPGGVPPRRPAASRTRCRRSRDES